jgi:hypothetical protein
MRAILAVENPGLIRYHRSGLEAREEDATTHFVEGIAAFRLRPGRSDVGKSLTLAKVHWRSRSQAERAQLNLQTQAKE